MFDRPPTYRLPDDASPSGRATALSAPPRAPRVDQSAEPSLSFASRPADVAFAPLTRDATIVRPDEPIPVGPGRPQPAYLFEDVDPPADFEPISRAKITPAPVRPETLHRGRLLDWLSRHVRRRLSFVVADAGYGKTTLLADFTQRGNVRCLWFKLDHTDGDWVTFINYLIAAYREAVPDFGRVTLPLLANIAAANPTREVVLGTFMSELGRLTEEPMLLILDDYHLVDESSDVQLIMSRLLRDAPPTLSYVLLTRRKPELPIGRLSAMGEVSELETGDLRFTREETGRLFAEGYGQPLEDDVLDEVERRTEGWAASLQLLRSTLRGRSNVEVRAFVRQLSGATEPVYDFLAQEVLREATPGMRRFLVGTSLLERIVPPHTVALFAADEPPPSEVALRERITEAYDVGLLGRRGESSRGFRYHPLLREFLLRQLTQEASPDEIREMHLRVALAAERDAWLTSCRHYIAAGALADAARVLVRSVLVALGTGSWGAAAEIVAQLEGHTTEPDIEVILALQEIEEGRLPEALDRLEAIDLDTVGPTTRALVRHGLYRANWWARNPEDASEMLRELRSDPETPPVLRDVAESHLLLFGDDTVSLEGAYRVLARAAASQAAAELHFFAGITYHNAAAVARARADYREAISCGNSALMHLGEAGSAPLGIHATQAILASCYAELGYRQEAGESAALALGKGATDADAFAELAYYLAAIGDVGAAEDACRRAAELIRLGPTEQLQQTNLALAVSRTALSAGLPTRVEAHLGAGTPQPTGIAAKTVAFYLRSTAAMAMDEHEVAAALAFEGLRLSRAEGSRHWEARLALVLAAAKFDTRELLSAVHDASRVGQLVLVENADAIAGVLQLLSPVPDDLVASVSTYGAAWLPALRRRMDHGFSPAGLACARLLDQYGAREDVSRLRAYERTYLKGTRAVGLGRALARRTAPVLAIHDLGPGWFAVGERTVQLGSIRRRASSLLALLLTRPRTTTTREQILDMLWPDLDPEAAVNSLNQTVYFLRREIEPDYDDDASFNYVRSEGELLRLDQELVTSDSARFADAASAAFKGRVIDIDRAVVAIRMYAGRFLPEFEYDDWAAAWRDRLHSSFLHLVHGAQVELVRLRRNTEAIDLTHHALAIDPTSPELERALIWLYASVGASTAAAEQYAHYATAMRSELGIDAPRFEDLIASPLHMLREE